MDGIPENITAHDAGAKVVVLEKCDRPNGNAIFALGSICGWGTRHQAEQGIKDTADAFYAMMMDEIILLTAHGNIPDGVQAIKNGAFDYITKGDDNNKIIPLVAKAMEKASAAYQQQKKEATFVGRQYSFDTIVGKSPAIQAAIALAQKVSATEVPVLLTGETGTGKEVFAQSIHQHSSRKGKSFPGIILPLYLQLTCSFLL